MLPEQVPDPFSQVFHDLVLAGKHRREIERQPVKRDAMPLEPLDGEMIELTRVEHRLAGNAADVQARAPERRVFLDASHLHSELRCANRRHVTAGAGADHDQVEL